MSAIRSSRAGTRDERDEIRHRIQAVVDSIPQGRVTTYGEVAALAGLPRRARWVGRVLRELPQGSRLPWHRVVAAQGRIALPPRAGGGEQIRRLRAEGVPVAGNGRIDLGRFAWRGE
jgi:methylated-DNA-protein-cysteine methyltransferase related protein